MRVIHLIGGGDTGGAKTHVLNLLKELNQSIDAQLFCFRKGDFSEDAAKMGIPIEVIESGNPVVGLRELKRRLAGQKVDIIHCHGARGNLMGNLVKKHLGAPVVTTVHSDYRLDYLGRPVARLSYGTTNMVALRRVNFYIGVSDPMTDILIERGFPADRIYTIYNGIDFKTPIHPVPKEEFLQSVGMEWEPGDVIAGIAVRLSPVKDVPTLLRAMKIASEKDPHLKLLIGGDGEDRQKLENMAKDLGLAGKVCFAGWLDDVNSFYNAIDINLLTSISETFPYSLTEGTRMHKATIASKVGGVPVLIDDGVNGLIFEPGDEKQLAQHLLALSQNRELRATFGERIYEKASREFSIDRMVEHQLEIYESILKRDARQKSRQAGWGGDLRGLRLRQRRGRRHFEIHHPLCAGAGRRHAHHCAGQEHPKHQEAVPGGLHLHLQPAQDGGRHGQVCAVYQWRRHPDPKRHQLAQPLVLPVHPAAGQAAGEQGGYVRLRHRSGDGEEKYPPGKKGAGPFSGHHHPAGDGLYEGAGKLWGAAARDPPQL